MHPVLHRFLVLVRWKTVTFIHSGIELRLQPATLFLAYQPGQRKPDWKLTGVCGGYHSHVCQILQCLTALTILQTGTGRKIGQLYQFGMHLNRQ